MECDFLKRIVKTLPDGIFVLDLNGKVLLWNKTIEEMTGIKEEDIIGKGDFAYSQAFYDIKTPMLVDYIINPRLLPLDKTFTHKHLYETETFLNKLYKGQGAWVRMTCAPINDEKGSLIGAIQIVRDISQRKKTEIEMKRLYNVIEHSPMGVAIIEFSGSIMYCNDSFCKSVSIDKSKKVNIYELFPSISLFEIHNGYIKEFKHGKKIFRLRGMRLHDDINGYALFLTDITEIRKYEEQIIISHKMETVRKLTSSYAHEIKNLLTGINGYCYLAMESNNIEYIKLNIEKVLQIANLTIENLIRILGTGKEVIRNPRIIDLVEVVEGILPMLTNSLKTNINFFKEIDQSFIKVFADSHDIEKILTNLIFNAQDAMINGGDLIITLSIKGIRDIYKTMIVDDNSAQEFAYISVKDTGTGIDDSIKDKIFEPFFTTKGEKGTGMGLPTVYEIVRQLDGFIFFESEVSKGTRFDVFIPLHKE